MSVRRSAAADGCSPSASSRARTKRSISFRGQFLFETSGGAALTGGMNDQCLAYAAPCSIQRLSVSFCSAVSTRCESGGGIISASSSLVMRRQSFALFGIAGTIAGTPSRSAKADSATSSRRSACRAFSSKPWHWKQFSERIGRTSRLKSSFGSSAERVPDAILRANRVRSIVRCMTAGPPGTRREAETIIILSIRWGGYRSWWHARALARWA